jgi:hypothetical protein
MKKSLQQPALLAIFACGISLGSSNVFGSGSDYLTNKLSNPSWPKGMSELVNVTNRVHGFWLNAEDVFFFSGSATSFASFLEDYSRIQGIEKHQLILRDGVGEAKSPWAKTGQPCDWELYGCPKRWRDIAVLASQATNSTEFAQKANQGVDYGHVSVGTNGQVKIIGGSQKVVQDTNYVLEAHFWTGGKIALDKVKIPPNVEVLKDKQPDAKPKQ